MEITLKVVVPVIIICIMGFLASMVKSAACSYSLLKGLVDLCPWLDLKAVAHIPAFYLKEEFSNRIFGFYINKLDGERKWNNWTCEDLGAHLDAISHLRPEYQDILLDELEAALKGADLKRLEEMIAGYKATPDYERGANAIVKFLPKKESPRIFPPEDKAAIPAKNRRSKKILMYETISNVSYN